MEVEKNSISYGLLTKIFKFKKKYIESYTIAILLCMTHVIKLRKIIDFF